METAPSKTVRLNQTIEADVLTDYTTQDSAELSPILKNQPLKIAKNGLRSYKLMVRKLRIKLNKKETKPKVTKWLR